MSELEMLSPGIRRYFRLRSISKSWQTPQLYNLTIIYATRSGGRDRLPVTLRTTEAGASSRKFSTPSVSYPSDTIVPPSLERPAPPRLVLVEVARRERRSL